jgi:hypothetical protein
MLFNTRGVYFIRYKCVRRFWTFLYKFYEINKIKEDNDMSKNVKEIKNVNAKDYVTKDAIRKELEGLGVKLGNKQFRSTKREELLKMLEKAKAQQPTIAEVSAQPVQPDKRREKYNLFCHLVKSFQMTEQNSCCFNRWSCRSRSGLSCGMCSSGIPRL